ncbi:MAG TPA: ATP-binding protein [Acidimicrobiales bacterium]|nr:ATP-binding protein [Acidimicrobiales bacterium]
MVFTAADFKAAFPGETHYVERKSGLGGKALQDAVVAFSNADGGVILIGVDDSGRLVGKELSQAAAESIHAALAEVHSPGRYEVIQLVVDRIPIIVIAVAKRTEGFAQASNGRVLVRRGPRNTALIGSDLREFISSRSLGRFEREASGVPLADVEDDALATVRRAFGWSDSDDLPERLEERGLVKQHRRKTTLTVAGSLLLLDTPRIVVPKAFIEILRFREGATEYDRRTEIDGPAFVQIREATRLVMDELGTEMVVLGLHRHELARVPEVVLREAIANAVAHRSYELSGSATRIEIRPHSVEITSPGGLPEPVTVKNIRETQAARNPDIITTLRRMGLAEDVGRGVDVMQDTMMEELLDPPRFEDLRHAVRVTLPTHGAVSPRERAWVRELETRGDLGPRDRILLVHAARGEVLTNSSARALLGVDSVHARQALQRLRDGGFLIQTGSRGGATYHLSDAIHPPLGLRMRRDEIEAFVLSLADGGPLTNATVRAQTGLDRVDALRILERLTARGHLIRRGERRGVHYVKPSTGQGLDFGRGTPDGQLPS